MFTELITTLKNSKSVSVNPFSIRGYASSKKEVTVDQVNQINEVLGSGGVSVDSINKSSLTSYFTPSYIIKPLCNLVQWLGVKGKLLEPSCGNGRFLVHAEKLGLEMTAVELDPIMGHLARSACPSADVRLGQRFEQANLSNGEFSVVLGNPPYGAIKPIGNSKKYGNVNILGYFILRGLEMLHVGGYEIFVASTWFLDSKVSDGREFAAKLGELAFALRLPNGCFSEEGVDLPVDILIFKRSYGVNKMTDILSDYCSSDTDWTKVVDVVENGKTYAVNSFFANNPDFVLGSMNAPENMFRSCSVESALTQSEIEKKIESIGKMVLQENGFDDTFMQVPVFDGYCLEAMKYRFNELYFDENLLIKQKKEVVKDSDGLDIAKVLPFSHPKSAHKALKAYLQLKSVYFSLVLSEYEGSPLIDINRKVLCTTYNEFIKNYGALNNKTNKKRLKSCSQYLRIAGLELNYQAENKEEGIKESYKPAEILSNRVFYSKSTPTKADNVYEALTISLMETGCLDIKRVSSLLGVDECEAIKVLVSESLAFELPEGGYESSIEYLSGNIQQKIDKLKGEPKFHKNHVALTNCLPKRVISTDISLPIGAIWLPIDYYTLFVNYLMGTTDGFSVIKTDRFHVLQKKYNSEINECNYIKWGNNTLSAVDILTALFNGKTISVYKTDSNGERVIDNQETLIAQSKADEIKDQFKEWVFSDVNRRITIEDTYNNLFNVYAKRDLSSISQYLRVENCGLKPYGYQLEAAFFALLNGGTMLDLPVGSGKSFTYMLFLYFLKKIYPETRAAIVMPGNLIGQFATEYMSAFPQSDIIVLDNELPKAQREEVLRNAVNNTFDAIIIPNSSFQALEAPTGTAKEILEEMIFDLNDCIDGNSDNHISTYRLETKKENLEARLKFLKEGGGINENITFDDLNLTAVLVDEAQTVKNISFSTSFTGVRGMGNPTGSQIAYDAYVKAKSILDGKGKVVFGTGTTLTNSVLELTTWFRMLAPHLSDTGLTSSNVDRFITLFSEPVTDFSIDSTGRNFKQYTSLKKFTNLPELSTLYSTFAYTLNQDELEARLPKLPDGRSRIPPLKGGKIETVILDISDEQDEIFTQLVRDAGRLTKERNMLAIMHDAKCASLDQRLFDPSLGESENCVINTAIKRIMEIHNESVANGVNGNQLVFCDKGIPNRHKSSEVKFINELVRKSKSGDVSAISMVGGKSKAELIDQFSNSFSVYDELERKLKEQGLRVAIIHDHSMTRASRNKLQNDFNSGLYDILIGSSLRLGSGWNLNRMLIASHDLDLPMTPGMLQQRWGRLLRQNNELYTKGLISNVRILTYTTKRTLDSWSFDLLDRKSKQFSSFANTVDKREIEPTEEVISLDELTAIVADNSLMLERVKLSHDIRVTQAKKRAFERKKHGYELKYNDMKNRMPLLLGRLKDIKADIAILEDSSEFFTGTNGDELDFRALNGKLNSIKDHGSNLFTIATSANFKVQVSCNILGLTAFLVGNYSYPIPFKGKSKDIIDKAYDLLGRLEEIDDRNFVKLCSIHKDISNVKAEVSKVFDDKGLSTKIKRLREVDLLLADELQANVGGVSEAA